MENYGHDAFNFLRSIVFAFRSHQIFDTSAMPINERKREKEEPF
jgi:hypothetical protein